jgi:hypothetical protein
MQFAGPSLPFIVAFLLQPVPAFFRIRLIVITGEKYIP